MSLIIIEFIEFTIACNLDYTPLRSEFANINVRRVKKKFSKLL